MTDLFVVGNGFDLYHGLPTRYIDFLSFIGNWNIFWENYKNIESGEEELQFSVRLSEYNELIPETMMDFAVHSGHYKYENLEFINAHIDNLILSILVDTFISKISFPMQPGPEIGSISDA